MGVAEGLGTRKVEVLADTAVTLEQGQDGVVASEVIKKLLSNLAHTADRAVHSVEKSKLWNQLTVLSRFLLALSFNNKLNVCKNAADVFYSCVLMMAHGSKFVRATIHGILLNTLQSIASLPQVMANEKVAKEVSLQLVEFSDSKCYRQFGLSGPASLSAFLQTENQHQGVSSRHPSTHENATKDSLSSSMVLGVVQQMLHVVQVCAPLLPEYNWLHRWQRLARRTSFYYNPALQTRSFLMLGVISERTDKINLLVSKTLKMLEETLQKHEEDVDLLEAIISCLTHFVPLLDQTCLDMDLQQHLFWVAVGVLQQGEATLYSAGLELMEACVKAINARGMFKKQTLSEVMQETRDKMDWSLTQMDKQVGLSFASHFHFALAGLLYRGFSHSLSTVRTRAQDLLTTLFFIHSPELNSTLTSAPIVVNQHNLAYLAALFPESELVREQLLKRRYRNKQQQPPTPIITDPSFNDAAFQSAIRSSRNFGSLLSVDVISTPKDQVLFLLVLGSALVQSPEDHKIELLYRFLSDASAVFTDVFPLIHCVLVEHMQKMLQVSQNSNILNSIQSLVTTAVNRSSTPSTIKSSYINDIGFGGLSAFFKPFPKQHPVYPTPQGALFQKYISTLTSDVLAIDTPSLSSSDHLPLKGSLSKLSMASTGSTGSLRETGTQGSRVKTSPSPWSPGAIRSRYTGSRSRETSPASVGNLSMDELDVED